MMKICNIIFLVFLSPFISEQAFSEQMYGMLSVGNAAEANLSASGQNAAGSSYSLLFGFHFNKNFAYEVGFTSLFSSAAITNSTARESLRGIEVAGVGNYYFNENLSVLCRLGYANMDPYYNAGPLVDNLVGFVYGIGAQYGIDKQFQIRAGYNAYNLTSPTGDSIVNNAYTAVQFNFK